MGGVAAALFVAFAFALGVVVALLATARIPVRRSSEPGSAAGAAERRLELLTSAAPLGIFELDAQGEVRYANQRWLQMTTQAGARIGGRDVWSGVHADDRASMAGRWHKAIADGGAFRARFRLDLPDGEVLWVVGQTTPLHDDAGALAGHVGLVLDVADLVEARQNLLRFQAIIDSTTDFVGLTDGDGQTIYLNPAAREALGIAGDADLAAIEPSTLYTEGSWRVIAAKAIPAVIRGEVWRGELSLRSPDSGRAIPISNVLLAQRTPGGDVDFVASIARDTSAQKALEARLQHQADHDELTALPNRTPLIAWLDEAIRHVDRFGSSVAVLFSDIDRFKVMNDSLGHQAGDQLLVAMSRRLLGATRPARPHRPVRW